MSIYDLPYRTDTPGGGTANMPETFDMFKRLLSPEEYDQLGQGNKMMFDNYMDYVGQFQKIQKLQNRGQSTGTQRVPQGGSWSVAGAGTPISTASNRQGATTKGGYAIPRYRTKTDITGKTIFVPIGQKQTMEGEYIPQSLEDVKSAEELQYAVPKIQTEAELDLVTKQAALAQAKAARRSPKAAMEEQRVMQRDVALQQTERRTALAEKHADDVNKRFFKAQDFREATLTLQNDLRKSQMELAAKLNTDRDKLKADERQALEEVKNINRVAQNKEQAKQSLANAIAVLNARAKIETDQKKQDRYNDLIDMLTKQETTWDLFKFKNPYEYQQAKDEFDQAQSGMRGRITSQMQNYAPQSQNETPPEEGAYWSEKQQKWWKQNPDGSIKWF